jgi:hypothetical protein
MKKKKGKYIFDIERKKIETVEVDKDFVIDQIDKIQKKIDNCVLDLERWKNILTEIKEYDKNSTE